MKIRTIQKLINLCKGKKQIDVRNEKFAFGEKFIYMGDEGEDVISERLLDDKPVLISRFGTVELETVRQFLRNKDKSVIFDPYQKDYMESTPGFFPSDDYNMVRFACEQIEVTKEIDVLGVRREKFEEEMCTRYLKDDAKLISIQHLGVPMYFKRPWTKHLKGKRVLVIHPFENSIKKQYAKRELLFEDNDFMPEFELITFKPVQGIADSKKDLSYETWFDALNDMKEKISKIDYDIALIGAGAYGMFLGAYCKAMGKKAIHMGGATQILFGIKGRRWDHAADRLYNEHWVRPSKEETPAGVEKFEHGTLAYW